MLGKATGSLIIFLSCTFIGYTLSKDCGRRPQQLRELQSLMQMLENQIRFLSNVLYEAFEHVTKLSKSETRLFFLRTAELLREARGRTAYDAWDQAVRENRGRMALNGEDLEIIHSFGKMLGSSDQEGQISNIRLTLDQLRQQEEKAEENRIKYEKMYRNLGVLGGLAIVIILL